MRQRETLILRAQTRSKTTKEPSSSLRKRWTPSSIGWTRSLKMTAKLIFLQSQVLLRTARA